MLDGEAAERLETTARKPAASFGVAPATYSRESFKTIATTPPLNHTSRDTTQEKVSESELSLHENMAEAKDSDFNNYFFSGTTFCDMIIYN